MNFLFTFHVITIKIKKLFQLGKKSIMFFITRPKSIL